MLVEDTLNIRVDFVPPDLHVGQDLRDCTAYLRLCDVLRDLGHQDCFLLQDRSLPHSPLPLRIDHFKGVSLLSVICLEPFSVLDEVAELVFLFCVHKQHHEDTIEVPIFVRMRMRILDRAQVRIA